MVRKLTLIAVLLAVAAPAYAAPPPVREAVAICDPNQVASTSSCVSVSNGQLNVSGGSAAATPSSFTAAVAGTTFIAGLGLVAVCTVAGNVVLMGVDGSTITVPVGVGYNQFGFVLTEVVSETATCTFTVLR